MRIDETHFLKSLRVLAGNGHDVGALDLHLDALIAARDGDLQRANESFAAAQEWESTRGYPDGALHTAHQMVLTASLGGNLKRLDEYYHETTITLTKMRNRKGVALCLRSVGEIAIVKPDSSELARAWDLSEQLFLKVRSPESAQIAMWRACVRQVLGAK